MKTLNLVKIIDTSGKNTGIKGNIIYQALTDDEEDNLVNLESDYSYIGRDFQVELIGNVQIPSFAEEWCIPGWKD
jgi:hypothetical protein